MASETQTGYGTGRARILVAAREVFGERGYRGATTRDIAQRANVTEPMIFRHFGSKDALFEEAAVGPVVAFIDDYVADWGSRPHGVNEAVAESRDFFRRLYEVLHKERDLLVAILAAGSFDEAFSPAAEQLQDAFGRVIDLFERVVDEEFTIRELTAPDRPALSRVILGMIMVLALHGDWLKIGGQRDGVSLDRMLGEAVRLLVYGVGDATRTY